MSVNFGDFVKNKRRKKNLVLKDVAAAVGISSVYQSSIEKGNRPAPSYEILVKYKYAMQLDEDEFAQLLDLAVMTKSARAVAYDIADYINENECVHRTLRFALKNNVPESEWIGFLNSIEEKYS